MTVFIVALLQLKRTGSSKCSAKILNASRLQVIDSSMDLQLAAGNLPGASQNSRDFGGLNTTKCDMRRNVTPRRKTDKTAWSILCWKLKWPNLAGAILEQEPLMPSRGGAGCASTTKAVSTCLRFGWLEICLINPFSLHLDSLPKFFMVSLQYWPTSNSPL